jgi:hypothetical protein
VGKRAEAQMRLVVDEACDDDDDGVGGRQMPWVWWYEFKEDDQSCG